MDHLRQSFAQCGQESRPALVAYVTAGFPTPEETPNILLGMQAGGADVIELGLPFTNPIADGPTIQRSIRKALQNGVTVASILEMVRQARRTGLTIPVLLMGYYNPLLHYGESKLLTDCQKAGVDGFIIVDLPPEEAAWFRKECSRTGLSYVPIITPSTTEDRMGLLCEMADSFVYLVSRMGVTGATGTLNPELPGLIKKVKHLSGNVPVAVGFGISTRKHFLDVTSTADGAVIGSQIITILDNAPHGHAAERVKDYCYQITKRKPEVFNGASPLVIATPHMNHSPKIEVVPAGEGGRFGSFGGQYVPESMTAGLKRLENDFNTAICDLNFWKEYHSYDDYIGRPSSLHLAERLTQYAGGANIWVKREDLNHTGSHHINSVLGQILIARRLGKTEIVTETGDGQHGVATATLCAKFGMKCTIYMGADDVHRQVLNVSLIRCLGATVVSVECGSRTFRDAIDEAFRTPIANPATTHHIVGSVIGPHPFPTIVRTFQQAIGIETKKQLHKVIGRLPDAAVAYVGGGSNAVGMFQPFLHNLSVELVGVEAAGEGLETSRQSATLSNGSVGVLHGARTYVLQNEDGQISNTHSIAAGLDYPGVGPELASWKESGRAVFISATDAQALQGLKLLNELEGIMPSLETSHAVWGAIQVAKKLGPGKDLVLCLSERGDKDMQIVADKLPHLGTPKGVNLCPLKLSQAELVL